MKKIVNLSLILLLGITTQSFSSQQTTKDILGKAVSEITKQIGPTLHFFNDSKYTIKIVHDKKMTTLNPYANVKIPIDVQGGLFTFEVNGSSQQFSYILRPNPDWRIGKGQKIIAQISLRAGIGESVGIGSMQQGSWVDLITNEKRLMVIKQ